MGTTALVFSNEDLNDKTKIVEEFLGESDLLTKGVRKTIKNEEKEQTSGFIDTLLGTLGASLLGNMLAGKEVVRSSNRWWWSNKSWWRTRYIFWYTFIEFSIDRVPKKFKKFIGNKNITTNIFRIQAYDSIMCGYICIGFVDFFFQKGKSFIERTNLFSPNEYEQNNKIRLKNFQWILKSK